MKAFHEASKQKKARAAGHAAHAAHAASVSHPCLTRFARSAACADHVPQGVLPVAPGSRPRCASRLRVPLSRLRIGDATLGLTRSPAAQRWTLPGEPGAKPTVLDTGKKLSDYGLKARGAQSAC